MDRTVTLICNSQAPSFRPSSVHPSAQIYRFQGSMTTHRNLQGEAFSRR